MSWYMQTHSIENHSNLWFFVIFQKKIRKDLINTIFFLIFIIDKVLSFIKGFYHNLCFTHSGLSTVSIRDYWRRWMIRLRNVMITSKICVKIKKSEVNVRRKLKKFSFCRKIQENTRICETASYKLTKNTTSMFFYSFSSSNWFFFAGSYFK